MTGSYAKNMNLFANSIELMLPQKTFRCARHFAQGRQISTYTKTAANIALLLLAPR